MWTVSHEAAVRRRAVAAADNNTRLGYCMQGRLAGVKQERMM